MLQRADRGTAPLSRQAALSGNDPSDSIRVVNTLLTQIDRLRGRPNVLLVATSNITGAIDVAFVDRAGMKVHVPRPGTVARYSILHSCVEELIRAKVVVRKPGERLASPVQPAPPPLPVAGP